MYYKIITAYRNKVKMLDIAKMYRVTLDVVIMIIASARLDTI